MGMISDFIESSKRIFIVSRKPDWKEFTTISKITAIGILVIALIGYVVLFIITMLNLF
ncbi:MAG: protein translocase SEC61 complex subunit gamma [Candidatus Diapherotrites archaeon]|nr:protein translocase SEC61 complex subunit gamma [Candidatus Diapherotrites archaeon]